MKKIYALLMLSITSFGAKAQGTICDSTANVIIYSNYEGGTLNINVDKNIPNLKIGVTSYENVQIVIGGTYSTNVTEVRYAGYNASNNLCGLGYGGGTTISGVAPHVDTIILYPAAGYNNSNGYSSIICNYSCDNTSSQGGCNTPDQLVYYYTTAFNGTFRYHYTQYGCWSSTPYAISAGGNCCIAPVTTGITATPSKKVTVYPNPATNNITVSTNQINETKNIYVVNMLGQHVIQANLQQGTATIDVSSLQPGVYFIQTPQGIQKFMKQ